MSELINNESIFTHKVITDTDLYSYLKDKLIVSMRLTNKLIKNKSLYINDKVIKKNVKIRVNDIIRIEFEDETHNYKDLDLPLEIVFENEDLIVINKPPGIVVHPTKFDDGDTVANRLSHYFKKINLKRKIRFVNRIDMDTSGLLIVAKNPYAHQFIAKEFDQHKVIKEYIAAVNGQMKDHSDIINQPIKKDSESGIYIIHPNGKSSMTEYEVIKECDSYSLVKCRLGTGRTHQIRVHLSSIGNPILGDSLYGVKSNLIERQALHSFRLVLTLPRTEKRVELKANLPSDMQKL